MKLISNTRSVRRTVWSVNATINVKKVNGNISSAMHMDHDA